MGFYGRTVNGTSWCLHSQPNTCLSHLHLGRRKTPQLSFVRGLLSAAVVQGLNCLPWELQGGLSELGFGCGRGPSDAETLLRPPTSAGVGWMVCGTGAGFPLVDTAARTRPGTHPVLLFPLPVLIFMLDSLLIFPS